jgi:glycosyltransferase involved in cell wall biosynthesis
MKILLQFGNKGSSLADHLIRPLSMVSYVTKILVVCRYQGPSLPKVEYHCPPGPIAKLALTAVLYEFVTLFYLALFKGPACVAGYLLNPHGILAFIVGKFTRKPVILSLIAGPFELYSRRKPLGVDYTKPLPLVGKLLLKMVNNSDAVITTGSFTKNFLQKQGVNEPKIFAMINPPNETRFKTSGVNKVYDVVSVGRLAAVKHNEIMIRVISKVKQSIPHIKFCMVGEGPCKHELVRLVNELGITENVDFVGFQKDVPHYVNISRVFILSSEREGFPNVVLEAMMCGLPCVVSNCGDIADIIRDGYNSFLIQSYGDVDGFARVITNLLVDHKLYNIVSQNALKISESLSAGEITKIWEELLGKIVPDEEIRPNKPL